MSDWDGNERPRFVTGELPWIKSCYLLKLVVSIKYVCLAEELIGFLGPATQLITT